MKGSDKLESEQKQTSERKLSSFDLQSRNDVKERRTRERHTQTERKISKFRQLIYCIMGDEEFRKQRQREASSHIEGSGSFKRHVNSVSHIDQAARILFPLSFATLNLFYWFFYLNSNYSKMSF